MAQSTIKNKKYSNSKKALEQRIKDLEFRNFELERTLENMLQLGNRALKGYSEPNLSINQNVMNIPANLLEEQRIRDYAFGQTRQTFSSEPVKQNKKLTTMHNPNSY